MNGMRVGRQSNQNRSRHDDRDDRREDLRRHPLLIATVALISNAYNPWECK